MKIINHICFALTMLCLGSTYAQHTAQNQQLASQLVGKWRRTGQMPDPLGGSARLEIETVYQKNGRFSSLGITHYKAGPLRVHIEGSWELKQGILVHHNEKWRPSDVRIPEWERALIRFLDQDHFQDQYGVSSRVP